MNNLFKFCLLVFISLGLGSCSWLDEDVDRFITEEQALETPEDFEALLNSCYDVLANLYDGDVQIINEMRGDNLGQPNANLDYKAIYNRETIRWNTYVGGVNSDFYYPVGRVNLLLQRVDDFPGLTEENRARIKAEALFIRALCFFEAVKMFAQPYGYTDDNSHPGIPIPTGRDPETGDVIAVITPVPRSTVAETYDQIESDLTGAIAGLPSNNGTYANVHAAKALLAQVHFLQLNWTAAEQLATEVIESDLFELDAPPTDNDTAFWRLRLSNQGPNVETIFGTYSSLEFNDDRTSRFRQYWAPAANPELTVSSSYLSWFNTNGGTDGDRRALWLEVIGDGKVKLNRFTDYNFFNVPVIHYTQMLLMRAECLGEMNTNLSTAIEDINRIRTRAGSPQLLSTSASADEVINAARVEYRKETLGMGQWVSQLQRRGVMGEDIVIRDAPWNCDGMALQFSASEGNVNGFEFNPVGGCN